MGMDYMMDMHIKLFELDESRVNKVAENIIRGIFEDIQKGNWPKFGSPETRCNKCMFYGVSCGSKLGRVGCLGGWKMEKE